MPLSEVDLPRGLNQCGETSAARLLLRDTLRAAPCTLILAELLAKARLRLARLQLITPLLRILKPKQLALLRTIQPPAALLCCLQPVEALLGGLQAPLFALLCALYVSFLSFKGAKLPAFQPTQVTLLQLLLQLFAAILRGFSACVRLSRNALLYAVLAVLPARPDSIVPGLHTVRHHTVRHRLTQPGRTLLSVALDALDALLTLLHPLLETFLPQDVRGGRRSLALRRSSRTLRRGRRAQCWGRSCYGRRR